MKNKLNTATEYILIFLVCSVMVIAFMAILLGDGDKGLLNLF